MKQADKSYLKKIETKRITFPHVTMDLLFFSSCGPSSV